MAREVKRKKKKILALRMTLLDLTLIKPQQTRSKLPGPTSVPWRAAHISYDS